MFQNYSYSQTWKVVEDKFSLRSPEVQLTIELNSLWFLKYSSNWIKFKKEQDIRRKKEGKAGSVYSNTNINDSRYQLGYQIYLPLESIPCWWYHKVFQLKEIFRINRVIHNSCDVPGKITVDSNSRRLKSLNLFATHPKLQRFVPLCALSILSLGPKPQVAHHPWFIDFILKDFSNLRLHKWNFLLLTFKDLHILGS
jgi:hypothetical protein